MESFVGNGISRVLVITLHRGEKLLESICEQLQKEGIKNGIVLSGIGTLQKTVFHRVTTTNLIPNDEFITVEKPIELSSLQGFVADGVPHFHMAFSDVEQAYTGHLENESTVLYVAEIIIAEISGLDLKREKDENNIAFLVRKGV